MLGEISCRGDVSTSIGSALDAVHFDVQASAGFGCSSSRKDELPMTFWKRIYEPQGDRRAESVRTLAGCAMVCAALDAVQLVVFLKKSVTLPHPSLSLARIFGIVMIDL